MIEWNGDLSTAPKTGEFILFLVVDSYSEEYLEYPIVASWSEDFEGWLSTTVHSDSDPENNLVGDGQIVSWKEIG